MFRIKLVTETSTHLKDYFLHLRAKMKNRPAVDEIDCLLAFDPTSLYVGELDDKPIGTACVFKYDNGDCNGGGYYVEKEYRKCGYGLQLYNHVVNQSKPFINMLGHVGSLQVFEMYKKYFGSGEILHSTELHDINSITALKKLQEMNKHTSYHIKQLTEIDFENLFSYDKDIFGHDRKQFLHKWLYSPASIFRVAFNTEGSIIGYAVARESIIPQEGYKIGPLFCEDIDVGKALLQPIFEEINKKGLSSSVHFWCPIERNPQVKELLTFLDSTFIEKHLFLSTNGPPKGCVDKWFAVASLLCG